MQNILITGASRGIGLGMTQAYLERGARVFAVARTPYNPTLSTLIERYGAALTTIACDLNAADALARIGAVIGRTSLDRAVFNAGIYGPSAQDVSTISAEETAQLFLSNAIAPVRLAQALANRMTEQAVVAFMSSQMASVFLNRATEMPLYGASKAALNSLVRSWSRQLEPLPFSILALHPGWVQTDLGGRAAPVSVQASVAGLIASIEAYAGKRECAFIDYQGQPLPW